MRIFGIGKLCGSEKHKMDRDKVVHCRVAALGPEPANRRGGVANLLRRLWIEQMAGSG
jgi:hypothetical protein